MPIKKTEKKRNESRPKAPIDVNFAKNTLNRSWGKAVRMREIV